MRLDKFLKVSRLAKRRTEAKDALDAGRIECGGRAVKASHAVKPGDELVIHYARRTVTVQVLAVPERSVQKLQPNQLYRVTSDMPSERA